MRLQVFASTLIGLAVPLVASVTSAITISSPAAAQSAQSNVTFYCGRSGGVPATMARTARGNVTIIKWVSTLTPVSPLARCRQVSSRFQTFYRNGSLRYLTTGKMNGQDVVCVAKGLNLPCVREGLLFTLKPGSDPNQTLGRLLDVSSKAAAPPLNESTTAPPAPASPLVTADNGQTYVDFGQFLNVAPTDQSVPGAPN
jgi:hypothetical protein